jgi:hypothetical protein
MPGRDAMFLVTGAALIAGCFFAGQSVDYRGIHLIFVVPGLAMRRAAVTRAPLIQVLKTIIFLMWADLFRRALHREFAGPG